MCSICGCTLPTERNGTTTWATRRRHVDGEKHQARLRALGERSRREREGWIREYHESQQRLKSNYLHLLMLSIVATRLRTQYESIDEARRAWRLESQLLLRRLDNPAVETEILEHVTKVIATTTIRSILQDSHVLVELISEHM